MTRMYSKYFSRKLLFTLFIALILSTTISWRENKTYQSNSSKYNKGLKYEEANNYKEALAVYSKIAQTGKSSAELLYHIGVCQLNLTQADSAVSTLLKARTLLDTTLISSDLSIDILLTLGKSYQLNFKPLQAIKTYRELQRIIAETDTELKNEIEDEIRICKNSMIFMDNPVEITIKNLGDKVNTKANDHTPVVSLSEEQLYYTSRQKREKERNLADGDNPEKIYHSTLSSNQWSKNFLLEVFFKNFENESALSLSADGVDLFLFRNDDEGQSLYQTIFDGSRWGKPFKLPAPINSPYNETHACLSPDKSTLFFTSDRPGGLGGKDIYLVRKNDNGQWGSLTNLGPNINSPEDEETPIFHYDGKTLYFASEGHNSMGRMDVFYSQMKADSTWNEPINLGYPINSPDDDFSFAPGITKDHAFYASARQGENYGGTDIYRVEFKKFLEGDLAVIEGQIIPKDSTNLSNGKVRILVTQKDPIQIVGNYSPNKKGEVLMFLETGKSYQVVQKEAGTTDVIKEITVSNELAYKPTSKFISFDSLQIEPPLLLSNNKAVQSLDIQNEEKSISQESQSAKIVPTNDKISNKENTSVINKDASAEKHQTTTELAPKIINKNREYTIQLLALKRRSRPFKNYFANVTEYKIKTHRCIDGYTRYTVGNFKTKEAAIEALKSIQANGEYQDAFVRSTKHKGERHTH